MAGAQGRYARASLAGGEQSRNFDAADPLIMISVCRYELDGFGVQPGIAGFFTEPFHEIFRDVRDAAHAFASYSLDTDHDKTGLLDFPVAAVV
jgi:hypothetical protein